MAATRLWFLRHGEPEAPHVGAFVGRTEADLSPMGRHQAEAVKEYLAEAHVDAILASPRRRARDTVAPLSAAQGLPVRPVAGFAEMDFGRWEGLHWEQVLRLDRAYAERWQADPAGVPMPDAEPLADFHARVGNALDEVLREFKGRSVVVGTHSGPCRSILAHILGIGYLQAFAFAQDYGCLNAAAWPGAGGAQVALVNFVPGPRSASAGE